MPKRKPATLDELKQRADETFAKAWQVILGTEWAVKAAFVHLSRVRAADFGYGRKIRPVRRPNS